MLVEVGVEIVCCVYAIIINVTVNNILVDGTDLDCIRLFLSERRRKENWYRRQIQNPLCHHDAFQALRDAIQQLIIMEMKTKASLERTHTYTRTA